MHLPATAAHTYLLKYEVLQEEKPVGNDRNQECHMNY